MLTVERSPALRDCCLQTYHLQHDPLLKGELSLRLGRVGHKVSQARCLRNVRLGNSSWSPPQIASTGPWSARRRLFPRGRLLRQSVCIWARSTPQLDNVAWLGWTSAS